ncbi:RTA1 like protein, partial [Rhizoctonia solani]
MSPLPTDIVLCITEHCQLNQLCTLSLLSKATCGVIAPALYRYVTLRDRKSIESFCNAIINGRTGLRSYPQTVAFLPKKTLIKALNALVPHIKQALGLMNALVDLTLGLPGKIIKAIFRDAHPSHSLRRLSCPLVAQAGFKRFLLEQSMIKELVVIGDVRGKINVGTLIRNPDEKLLPNLESLSANYDTLNALVPGRPLKTISMGSAILNVPHFQTFGAVLSQSSTPIASLSACISCAPFLLGAVVNHLIESLNENQVFPHALSITLVFPEKTSADHRAVHPHVQECLQLMKIGQLDGLERFEVSARDCPCPLTVEFHRIAHEIALLPRWTNLCSTLKEVTLFGKLLEALFVFLPMSTSLSLALLSFYLLPAVHAASTSVTTTPQKIDPFTDAKNDPRNPLRYIPSKELAWTASVAYFLVVLASIAWSFKYRARYMLTLMISGALYALGLYFRTGL